MEHTNFNKVLNEKYALVRDIAQKHNYNEELINMLTLIYISFYMDLGKQCDMPFYDILNRISIIYDRGNVNQISQKYNLGSCPNESAAVTIFTPNLEVFNNPNLKQHPQKILLATHVGDKMTTNILRLEMLLHEIRHTLMGYYNTNILLDNTTYYMRSGLQEIYYTKKNDYKNEFDVREIGTIFDEVLNSFITEKLINKILSFKKNPIENKNLKTYLETLKTSQSDSLYRSIGYNTEIRLMYPLLMNDVFINLCNTHQFDGKLEIIKEFININSDYYNYEGFNSLFEKIHKNIFKYSEMISTSNMDNEFVQKFINDVTTFKKTILNLNDNINANILKKRL